MNGPPPSHPLQNKWALWYHKSAENMEWEDCLKLVAEFDTVEGFWGIYNHIQTASGLTEGSDYYFFKAEIQPKWEDAKNKDGGRFLIFVNAADRKGDEILDRYWLQLILAMIGEQFDDYGHHICGAVVNVRGRNGSRPHQVSLWNRYASDEGAKNRIREILMQTLKHNQNPRYQVHKNKKDIIDGN